MSSWVARHVPDPKVGRYLLREEGEVIVDEVAHHWVAYRKAILLCVLGLVLLVAVPFTDPDIAWILILAALAVSAYAAVVSLTVHLDRFVVTNMRVFRVSGLFNRTKATMPLSRILDITVQQPVLGRLLGYGHFVFESAAQEQGLRDIRFVDRPEERDLTIQRVVQRAGLRGPRIT